MLLQDRRRTLNLTAMPTCSPLPTRCFWLCVHPSRAAQRHTCHTGKPAADRQPALFRRPRCEHTVPHVPLALSPHKVIMFPHCRSPYDRPSRQVTPLPLLSCFRAVCFTHRILLSQHETHARTQTNPCYRLSTFPASTFPSRPSHVPTALPMPMPIPTALGRKVNCHASH